MEARRQVAVFGGSFDPPHCAHVMVVSYVLACTECDEVWVVPVAEHAFDKQSARFEARLAMCRAAFAPLGERVRVLDVEARLPWPSYTVQTLRELRAARPDVDLVLVMGSDIPAEAARWKAFDEVARLARILVVGREGAPAAEVVAGPRFPEVSSTAIREALAGGRDVSALVPRGALEVIRKEGLYGAR
ncbi:MAG: nicotinate (nicotinamide) nucleotide adenylyltransferase [Deltaproteobacteria bacterium]|nr:nicotinate (nicotinamide) nucleotide adenylyltransferase [Deltaproteobacteria bacterium]